METNLDTFLEWTSVVAGYKIKTKRGSVRAEYLGILRPSEAQFHSDAV